MKVLYFGTYERRYPRNAQVISCLRRTGVEVAERHVGVWEGQEHTWNAGARAAGTVSFAARQRINQGLRKRRRRC